MTRPLWSWPRDERALMAIINVTPDSFYDGGVRSSTARAIDDGVAMWAAGARYLDVGGESSRPGAEPVSEAEELRRVLPVIEGLVKRAPEAVISIDTVKPNVARRAVEAGARVINNIRGGRDPEMREVMASTQAGVVLMHMRGAPKTMQQGDLSSADISAEVCAWLKARAALCEAEGVAREAIMLDPGIGFGKTPQQNLELIARLPELANLGYPVLLALSRKSYIGALTGAPAEERLAGTIASYVYAALKGPQLWRVHDVREAQQALTLLTALLSAEREVSSSQPDGGVT